MGIFKIENKCDITMARSGIVTLPHGEIKTPVFMNIGTLGTVKGLSYNDVAKLGTNIMLSNTYHLWLKPGTEVLDAAGGLHKFNNWNGNIITDSGGFQAFSLGKNVKFTEEGVQFRNPKNGDKLFLSPEISMQIQHSVGSDITLVLDELAHGECKEDYRKALHRTHRWAKRSFDEWSRLNPGAKDDGTTNVLFGIPQGMGHVDLREESAHLTKEIGFHGYSIGGVSPWDFGWDTILEEVVTQTRILEEDKPRHLLGVGTPEQMVQMIAYGIDMFDCVYPTRNARHGSIMLEVDESSYRSVQITNKEFQQDFSPINPNSRFEELRNYTKAYLNHTFRVGEPLALRLGTLQNLEFYVSLMERARTKIEDGTFKNWYKGYRKVD